MDKRTVFADGLTFPNGVLPWGGGLIVTCGGLHTGAHAPTFGEIGRDIIYGLDKFLRRLVVAGGERLRERFRPVL